MTTKRKIKKYHYFTKTFNQAKIVLNNVFKKNIYELNGPIQDWLLEVSRIKEADIVYEHLSEILDKYSFNELLHPDSYLIETGKNRYLRIAALHAYLVLLIEHNWIAYGKAIHTESKQIWNSRTSSEKWKKLKKFINKTDVSIVQYVLHETMSLSLERKFNQQFFEGMNKPSFIKKGDFKNIGINLEKYTELMTLYGLLRSFIDSSFFLFNNMGDNPTYFFNLNKTKL